VSTRIYIDTVNLLFFAGNIRTVLGDCVGGKSHITIGDKYIGMDDLRLILGGHYSDLIRPTVIELDLAEEVPRPGPTVTRIGNRKVKWTPYIPKPAGISKSVRK
jgi:hypothetical protein